MRILIIGLDGASWTIIDPLLDQGKLPNLAHLIEGGTRATLRSFEPALSPILWTSIATGKMPEKHGVTRYFHTANNLRTKRLWDILGAEDQPIGLWSWPVTWPPRRVNGFIIPSLFARADDTYPPDLRFIKELEAGMSKGWIERVKLTSKAMAHGLRPATVARILGYSISDKLGRFSELDRYIEQRLLKLEIHLDLYVSLVRKHNPHFSVFYLNQTDALAHRCWRYFEPHLFPDVDAHDVEKYKGVIPGAYEMADKAVGQLLQLTDDNTLVIVLSDHGFQAELQEGDEFYGRILGDRLLSALNLSRVSYVNYRRFVVIELPRPRPDIVELLGQLQVREREQPLLRVDEDADGRVTIQLYEHGSYQGITPEELSELHVVLPHGERAFLDFVEPHYNERQSGTHHIEGIGVFHGPGVQPGGCVDEGSIIDVAPTILALLGMPVGRDMDGHILTEVVSGEFLERQPISYIDTYDSDLEPGDSVPEEEVPPELMSRLRALGYVD